LSVSLRTKKEVKREDWGGANESGGRLKKNIRRRDRETKKKKGGGRGKKARKKKRENRILSSRSLAEGSGEKHGGSDLQLTRTQISARDTRGGKRRLEATSQEKDKGLRKGKKGTEKCTARAKPNDPKRKPIIARVYVQLGGTRKKKFVGHEVF